MTQTQTQQPPVDLEQVAAQTVQQLGAQLAMLTYELNAQRSAAAALQRDVDEKTEQIADRDAELGRVRQASSHLQARLQQLDGQLADARADTAVREPADHEQQPAGERVQEDTGAPPEEGPGES